jgi:hypothetical protein
VQELPPRIDERDIRSARHPILSGLFLAAALALIAVVVWLVLQPVIVIKLTELAFQNTTEAVVSKSGWSRSLVQAILVIALIPFGWAVQQYVRFGVVDAIGRLFGRRQSMWRSRTAAGVVLAMYTAAYFGALYLAGRNTSFDQNGNATKYWAFTPAGPRVYDEPGVDREYGIKLQPMTVEIRDLNDSWNRGDCASRITVSDVDTVTFFNGLGQPVIWYAEENGGFQLFNSPEI